MSPNRKKSKKKQTRSKSTTARKLNKKARATRAPKLKAKKKTARKSRAAKKAKTRTPAARRRTTSAGNARRAALDQQTGDLQGLSGAEQADSESVEELAEEGNLFEAGAVAGVEEADSADEREVHTHEVPEDDVPEEYLDKD